MRGGEEEAKQAETHYEQAKAQTDKDYEETAAAVAEKKFQRRRRKTIHA